MLECFHCGDCSITWDEIWINDCNFEEYGYEGKGIVHKLHCYNCGATIIYLVPQEEQNNDEE